MRASLLHWAAASSLEGQLVFIGLRTGMCTRDLVVQSHVYVSYSCSPCLLGCNKDRPRGFSIRAVLHKMCTSNKNCAVLTIRLCSCNLRTAIWYYRNCLTCVVIQNHPQKQTCLSIKCADKPVSLQGLRPVFRWRSLRCLPEPAVV